MLIGNGLLAQTFKNHNILKDVIIFASGVSNSQETDSKEFTREEMLLTNLLNECGDKLFIYFGTCSVYDTEAQKTPYVHHKREMESLIIDSEVTYLIVRLPQVVGKSNNKNTLTNYLYDCIVNETPFELWQNTARSLIDVEDVVSIVKLLVEDYRLENTIVNVAPKPCNVLEIVRVLECITQKRSKYKLVEKGSKYQVDSKIFDEISQKIGTNFDRTYYERVLCKYYS